MINIYTTLISAALLATLSTGFANAQNSHHAGPHHEGYATTPVDQGHFAEANKRMMDDMHSIELTGDADHDFVRGMIVHHQGAIDMARVQLAKGQDPAIISLAQGVVEAQEIEIKLMEEWLQKNTKPAPGEDAVQIVAAWQRINDRMMQDMHVATSGNTDHDFITGMIPHHVAAVDMSYVLLAYSKDEQLRKLAWDVIGDQEQEIVIMKRWAAEAGGEAPAGGAAGH